MKRAIHILLLAALSAGCTGEGDSILDQFGGPSSGEPLNPGEARITGDFGLSGFNPTFAWSDRITLTDPEGLQGQLALVLLGEDAGLCNDVGGSAPSMAFGTQFVLMQIGTVVGSNTLDEPQAPGDFEIGATSGDVAFAGGIEVNASAPCGFTTDGVDLTSGTVTLDTVTTSIFGGSLEGSGGGESVEAEWLPSSCSLDSFYNAGFQCI